MSLKSFPITVEGNLVNPDSGETLNQCRVNIIQISSESWNQYPSYNGELVVQNGEIWTLTNQEFLLQLPQGVSGKITLREDGGPGRFRVDFHHADWWR